MNNSSTVLDILSLYKQQSLYLLQQQLLWNVLVFLVAAPAAAIANSLIVVVLLKNRNIFKTHHYRLLAHMASVSFLLAFNSIFAIGVKRVYFALSNTPEVITTLNCGLQFVLHDLFLFVDALNVVIVASDRLLAVTMPIRYKNLNLMKSYKIATIVAPWIPSVLNIVVKYALYTKEYANTLMVICILANTRPKEQTTVTSNFTLAICSFTVLLYFSGIVVVNLKLRANRSNLKNMKKDLGYRLIISSGTDGVINSCTSFVGAIFVAVLLVKTPVATQIITGPISFGFYSLCLTSRFFVLFGLNTEFKKCVVSLICKKNKVSSVSSITQSSKAITKETNM